MSQQEPPTPARRRVIANVIRGSVGNLLEWYDWFAYSSFAIYFAASFFPRGNQTAQLLSAAIVFGVGFLMRPLGAWLLGRYADRSGRRTALTLSVSLMSLGSAAIALTPGYRTIGIAAPILLVVARLAHGISVGGEYGSSATYLAEVATPGRRGFYSSFNYVSIVLGQLLALLVLIILQAQLDSGQMAAWGWRIPFAIGALAGLVALYLRRSMDESQHFTTQRTRATTSGGSPAERHGLRALITRHPRPLLAVLGLGLGETVTFYTFTTYLQQYLVNTAGLPKPTVAHISFAALFIFMLLQPAAGALSDRIGRKPMMLFFSIGGLVATIPILTALAHNTSPWIAFLLMTSALVILACSTSVTSIIKAEMFPTRLRALGVSLAQALVAGTFAGFTEPIALGLKNGGHESAFYWYVTGCIALTLLATLAVREPSRTSHLDSHIAVPEAEASPTKSSPGHSAPKRFR